MMSNFLLAFLTRLRIIFDNHKVVYVNQALKQARIMTVSDQDRRLGNDHLPT